MIEFHEIQLEIFKTLLFSQALRFSELLPGEMENSQFNFHLARLIELGYVQKVEQKYSLTTVGKELANRVQAVSGKIELQAKITTVLCAIQDNGPYTKVLLYNRLKHPFYSCQGFPTEKVRPGEDIYEAASRGLKEETGLIGIPILFAIRHYRVFLYTNDLVEDKLMHAFLFKNPTGKLITNHEGNAFWVDKRDVKSFVKKPLLEFNDFYNAILNFRGNISFEEKKMITENF